MADLDGLFSDLIRLETELWAGVDARLRTECDLPLNRFEPMQVIARHGSCRVLDIATELAIGVSGTSKLVDRIEAAGHCRRRPNREDRRSSIVELTRDGTELLDRATVVLSAELELRIGAVLDPGERDVLADLLTRLRHAAV